MPRLNTLILQGRAIIGSLSLFRFINVIKSLFLYWASLLLKSPFVPQYPLALSVEPTSICNLKCPECPTGTNSLKRARGMMTLDKYKSLIDEVSKYVLYLNLYVQGEPFMHPDFPALVRYASNKGMYTSSSTNAHFISAHIAKSVVSAGLKRLVFSLDGTTQSTYVQYRKGGEFNKVIEGIKQMVSAKKSLKSSFPIIELQFLVFQHNEHEMEAFRLLASQLQVDSYTFKSAQIYALDQSSVKPPQNKKYSRYLNQKLKGTIKNRCWRVWSNPVVTWDGQLAPCCYDKDADWKYGNVFESSFPALMSNKHSSCFHQQVLKDKSNIEMCLNCPEGRG